MEKIFQNGKFKQYEKLPNTNPILLKWQLLFRCPIYQPTMLLKKSMVLKVKNYNHLQTAQDYDLWLRLIQIGEIRIINKPLIKYRITSNSVSEINRKNWSDINLTLFKKYNKYFLNNYDQKKIHALWRAISPHSDNNKIKFHSKEFLECIYSFCEKNNVEIFNILKSQMLIKQFLKIQNSILSYNFILFLFAILFKSKKILNKILD